MKFYSVLIDSNFINLIFRFRCKARAISKIDDPLQIQITNSLHNHGLQDYKMIPSEAVKILFP